jgi:hypothetical protein
LEVSRQCAAGCSFRPWRSAHTAEFNQAIRATFSYAATAFDQTVGTAFGDLASTLDQAIGATFGNPASAFD